MTQSAPLSGITDIKYSDPSDVSVSKDKNLLSNAGKPKKKKPKKNDNAKRG